MRMLSKPNSANWHKTFQFKTQSLFFWWRSVDDCPPPSPNANAGQTLQFLESNVTIRFLHLNRPVLVLVVICAVSACVFAVAIPARTRLIDAKGRESQTDIATGQPASNSMPQAIRAVAAPVICDSATQLTHVFQLSEQFDAATKPQVTGRSCSCASVELIPEGDHWLAIIRANLQPPRAWGMKSFWANLGGPQTHTQQIHLDVPLFPVLEATPAELTVGTIAPDSRATIETEITCYTDVEPARFDISLYPTAGITARCVRQDAEERRIPEIADVVLDVFRLQLTVTGDGRSGTQVGYVSLGATDLSTSRRQTLVIPVSWRSESELVTNPERVVLRVPMEAHDIDIDVPNLRVWRRDGREFRIHRIVASRDGVEFEFDGTKSAKCHEVRTTVIFDSPPALGRFEITVICDSDNGPRLRVPVSIISIHRNQCVRAVGS